MSRPVMFAALLAAATLSQTASAASQFVLEFTDGPGVGFNDPRPATPVGGNMGTTVGAQRKAAMQFAADTWGKILGSSVPIVVRIGFSTINCSMGVAPLGHAGPATAIGNFPGFTPIPGLPDGVWLPIALANALAGEDIAPDRPDIAAEFNGDLPNCFPISPMDWYYGFDAKPNEDQVDLVETALHEFAHGLGFTSMVDANTGALFGAPDLIYPDAFVQHVYDTTAKKLWPDLTDAERASSARNVRKLVWQGSAVTAAAAKVLAKGATTLSVVPEVAGFRGAMSETNFNAVPFAGSVSGPLALGSVTLPNCDVTGSLGGKIGLVTGASECSFVAAAGAERLGALASIVVDADRKETPPRQVEVPASFLAGDPIKRPAFMLSVPDADLLRAASGVTVTLASDPSRAVGADETGRAYLYASNPILPASTVSHWDPLARPNLLQEPVAPLVPSHDMQMEVAAMKDIGWPTPCGNGKIDPDEECDNGASNSDTMADACRTSCTKARCGDGVVDTGEACDDGLGNSSTKANACRTTCVKAKCGDGVKDDGEACDNGAANADRAPNACRTTCVKAKCGDGVVDDGEQCDEGVTNGTGACLATCMSVAGGGSDAGGGGGGGDAGKVVPNPPRTAGDEGCGCRMGARGGTGAQVAWTSSLVMGLVCAVGRRRSKKRRAAPSLPK
jgi:hypothetical protein